MSYQKHPEWIWDRQEEQWYRKEDLETKIHIYEDRVRGWFLEWGERLRQEHNAGFVVLMIAVGYLEGNQQYREGESSLKKSKKFVAKALNRICGAFKDRDEAKDFYLQVRCGLFHDGMTRSRSTSKIAILLQLV